MTLSLRILLFDGDGDSRCGAQYVATNHQRHPWLPYDADVDVDVGQNLAAALKEELMRRWSGAREKKSCAYLPWFQFFYLFEYLCMTISNSIHPGSKHHFRLSQSQIRSKVQGRPRQQQEDKNHGHGRNRSNRGEPPRNWWPDGFMARPERDV